MPRKGAAVAARPLKDWARFNRVVEVSSGPRRAAYGLAAVSSVASPVPIIKEPRRKTENSRWLAAGIKRKQPALKISSPVIIPFL
ncbi:hypothetical protein D9M68_843560 [compost metagenome]